MTSLYPRHENSFVLSVFLSLVAFFRRVLTDVIIPSWIYLLSQSIQQFLMFPQSHFLQYLLLAFSLVATADGLANPQNLPKNDRVGSCPSCEQVSFSYGESCLLGSPGAYFAQNLWTGRNTKVGRLNTGQESTPQAFPSQSRVAGATNSLPSLKHKKP